MPPANSASIEEEETPEQAAPVEGETPGEEAAEKELGVDPKLRRKATYRSWIKAVNEYAGELLTEWERWTDMTARQIARTAKQDHAKLIDEAATAIVAKMDGLARARLPDAYALGAKKPFAETTKGAALVDQFVKRNNSFLQTSLRPAIKARLQEIVDAYMQEQRSGGKARGDKGLKDLLGRIREGLGTFLGRVASYAGPFWTLIQQGLGELWGDRRDEAEENGEPLPKLAWVLDPAAAHCGTCPPKAGTYDSLDELLQKCGGFPAEGQDECGCNCRCSVDIE